MQLAQQTWPRCTPVLMQFEQTAKWQTAHTICSQCASHQHSITPASMTLRRNRGVYIDQGNDFWDDNPSVNNNESSPSPQRYWKMQVLLFFFFFFIQTDPREVPPLSTHASAGEWVRTPSPGVFHPWHRSSDRFRWAFGPCRLLDLRGNSTLKRWRNEAPLPRHNPPRKKMK